MRRLLPVTVLACLALCAPAGALTSRQVFGIGNTYDLSAPSLLRLKPAATRYLAAWNVALRPGFHRERVDAWYDQAMLNGLDPLLSFQGGPTSKAPSVTRFAHAFRRALARWPGVGEWQTWNEGNHRSQPVTWRHPERNAAYAEAMEAACPRCTILPVTIVLSNGPKTRWWIKKFLAAYGRQPAIWAVHVYGDVNRRSNSRLAAFVKAHPRGRIWITETGAFASFAKLWPFNLARQGRYTPYVFNQALRFRSRVDRLYWWQWRGGRTLNASHWDTGLVDVHGKPRPAYYAALKARFRSR